MDILSYIIGLKKGTKEGEKSVIIDGDYVFTDANHDGNIVITKENE